MLNAVKHLPFCWYIKIPISFNTTPFSLAGLTAQGSGEQNNIYQMTNGGVIANVNDALNTMLARIKALEARFQQLLPSYDTEVEINLN